MTFENQLTLGKLFPDGPQPNGSADIFPRSPFTFGHIFNENPGGTIIPVSQNTGGQPVASAGEAEIRSQFERAVLDASAILHMIHDQEARNTPPGNAPENLWMLNFGQDHITVSLRHRLGEGKNPDTRRSILSMEFHKAGIAVRETNHLVLADGRKFALGYTARNIAVTEGAMHIEDWLTGMAQVPIGARRPRWA
ncbi:MAG: hypothetical protein H6865_00605 [Rhodospirillales bacterium]|nr:hypothetical protein [Alphaproteobacteria bacterium]MCB9986127.1 hypothetical protein [Rhodospirillales bacterium]USO07314.1 MAG: hypothetical protein H6866_07770 [Rhodospirillales bacterium]